MHKLISKLSYYILIIIILSACSHKSAVETEPYTNNGTLDKLFLNQQSLNDLLLTQSHENDPGKDTRMLRRIQRLDNKIRNHNDFTDKENEALTSEHNAHLLLLEIEEEQLYLINNFNDILIRDNKRKQIKSRQAPKKRSKKPRKMAKKSGSLASGNDLTDLMDANDPFSSIDSKKSSNKKPKPTNDIIKRFPTIESPDEVLSGDSISVLISLTEDLITPTVKITQGNADTKGRLKLSLPAQPEDTNWEIDVVLSASGFTFNSPNKATIILPKNGDSTPAMFQLTVKNNQVISSQRQLYATFWYKGQYIARVMKPIIVNQANQKASQTCAANAALSAESQSMMQHSERVNLKTDYRASDLTIYMRRDWDSCSSNDYFITLSSPHIDIHHERINLSEDIGKWLIPKYRAFSKKGRGISFQTRDNSSQTSSKDQLLGFGKLIYKKFAPKSFKSVYSELQTKLGSDFKSIKIYTDDPGIPWELMVPDKNDNFIGIKHTVGRWIIPKSASNFTSPEQNLTINGIRLIVPKYSGSLALNATTNEALHIYKLPWKNNTEIIKADYDSFKKSLQKTEPVIIHYAGHGYTTHENEEGISEYGLILEDENLRALNWRGLLSDQTNRSLVFFNACDVGQAGKAAGFIDGWSTTLADTGSSGFISSLWELGDQGASEFSKRFYDDIKNQFKTNGKASIAAAMKTARQAFIESGNPTYLAYVFYGDPELVIEQAPENKKSDKSVIRRNHPQFYRIYNRELRKNPDLQGKIKLQITISPNGRVANVSIVLSEFNSNQFTKRLLRRLKHLKFDSADNLKSRIVFHTFNFHPENKAF
ncbi:MAG: hypothetical protein DIZ80_15985 [endosymbiont of Galathealinum brachiosum]|uniref:CHAT domain-containing protein n=1 Tax=endosymbiont of Galathealinum brachiosum TaxID=2200906 RepID=A0A370DB22_9GAMM|nr:MAG: hypothetical protein DIZ80_15985 [endosymbiont of Galathealinum brachiosum]